MLRHFQQYFKYITEVIFLGGGNRSTQRKPLTHHKSLTNFITKCCIEYTSPWAVFELTMLVVIGTDCIGSCKSNYHTITSTMARHLLKMKNSNKSNCSLTYNFYQSFRWIFIKSKSLHVKKSIMRSVDLFKFSSQHEPLFSSAGKTIIFFFKFIVFVHLQNVRSTYNRSLGT